MTSSPHTIDIENASKNFGKITAVDRLNLVIDPGEVVAFLGPNGAGKTTTVDMILGLSEPTSGTVKVFGDGPRSAIALGRVAAVMQTGGLLKDFTVRETVELTASLFRPVRPVEEVLERAGIIGIANRLVGKASGGEQQRLRFALALLADPDLLILDEPFVSPPRTAGSSGGDQLTAVARQPHTPGGFNRSMQHQVDLLVLRVAW